MNTSTAIPEEIAILARRAGLHLAPQYLAELADADIHLRAIVGRLHRGRRRADEPAHVYLPERHAGETGEQP